jgi:hypothetical protein
MVAMKEAKGLAAHVSVSLPIGEAAEDALLMSCRYQYVMFLLLSGSKKLNAQLFYWTALLCNTGISMRGVMLLGHLGCCLDVRTYRIMRDQWHGRFDVEIR